MEKKLGSNNLIDSKDIKKNSTPENNKKYYAEHLQAI